jgi:hypothetical protein
VMRTKIRSDNKLHRGGPRSRSAPNTLRPGQLDHSTSR